MDITKQIEKLTNITNELIKINQKEFDKSFNVVDSDEHEVENLILKVENLNKPLINEKTISIKKWETLEPKCLIVIYEKENFNKSIWHNIVNDDIEIYINNKYAKTFERWEKKEMIKYYNSIENKKYE